MTEPMNDERAIALLNWLGGTNGGIVSIDDIDALKPYVAKRFREMVAAAPRPDPPEVDEAMVDRACVAFDSSSANHLGTIGTYGTDAMREALTAALSKPAAEGG